MLDSFSNSYVDIEFPQLHSSKEKVSFVTTRYHEIFLEKVILSGGGKRLACCAEDTCGEFGTRKSEWCGFCESTS